MARATMRLSVAPKLWSHATALVGFLIWLVLMSTPLAAGELRAVTMMLLAAVLVLVPLALPLLETREWDGQLPLAFQLALLGHPFAAALLVIALFVETGPLAGLLTLGWLTFTGLIAIYGYSRFLPDGRRTPWEEVAFNGGMMLLPVGGVWLLISRLGATPLGLDPMIVLLTAVHFHFAGFLLPLLIGLVGRKLPSLSLAPWQLTAYRAVVVGVLGGILLVALGITVSRAIEMLGVFILAASVLLFVLLAFQVALTLAAPRRHLLALSVLLLVLPIVLAMGYALGNATGAFAISIPRMVQVHGWGNALALLLGLLAWSELPDRSESS